MEIKKCIKCGYELFPLDKVCDKCGTKVTAEKSQINKNIPKSNSSKVHKAPNQKPEIDFDIKRVLIMLGCGMGILLLGFGIYIGVTMIMNRPKTNTTETIVSPESVSATEEPVVKENSSEHGIEVDKGLFDVEITLPASLAEGVTQEELDAKASEGNYKSAILNSDGSVTYKMSKAQHKNMLDELKISINESLDEFSNSEDYPNVSKIEADSDYVNYKIYLKTSEIGLTEAFLPLGLYIQGGMYSVFAGTNVDNIHVDYIDESTGNVIESTDSKNMGSTDSSDSSTQTQKDEKEGTENLGKTFNIGDTINFDGVQYTIVSFNEYDNTDGMRDEPEDGHKWYELSIDVINNSDEERNIDIMGSYYENDMQYDTYMSYKKDYATTLPSGKGASLGIVVSVSDNAEKGEYELKLGYYVGESIMIKLF